MDALTCPHCGLSILQDPELSATTWLCGGCQGLVSRSGQSRQHAEIRQDHTGSMSLILPIGVNGWAIAGSYLSLVGPCGGQFAPILGIVALRQLKKNRYQRGKVRSWIAIVLGSIWIALTLFGIGSAVLPSMTTSTPPPPPLGNMMFENPGTIPQSQTKAQLEAPSSSISLADVQELWTVVRSPGGTRRDYEQARESARLAAAKFPGNRLVLRTIGVADYRCGDPVSAILSLTAARKLSAEAIGREDPIDIAFLAMCHHARAKAFPAEKELAEKELALVMTLMKTKGPVDGAAETAAIIKEMEELFATPPGPGDSTR